MSQNQDEQINSQQLTSETGEETQQTPVSSTQGQSENVDGLPDKFAGKSAADIAQAYRELEKERGRLASELGSARKEREDTEYRFRNLEQAVARHNSVPSPQQQAETDPFSTFEESFDNDPKQAIKQALLKQQDLANRQAANQSMQQRAVEAQDFYWRQKKENQDYARREPLMQQLVSEYQDIIRPEFLNSKKALEALDLMSRGRDVDYYTKQAVATASKNGSSQRNEKLRAQSESGSSDGSQGIDTGKMSSKDIAKLLKRSDE